jgi:hypothetical protein
LSRAINQLRVVNQQPANEYLIENVRIKLSEWLVAILANQRYLIAIAHDPKTPLRVRDSNHFAALIEDVIAAILTRITQLYYIAHPISPVVYVCVIRAERQA